MTGRHRLRAYENPAQAGCVEVAALLGTIEVGSVGRVARDLPVTIARVHWIVRYFDRFFVTFVGLFAIFAINSKRIVDSVQESRKNVCYFCLRFLPDGLG